MESPYDVLGVSPDATLSQIETTFQRQWIFWNDLRSNANRAAEAEAMIARLEFAHAQALARFQGQEGGLVDPAPTTQSGFGGSGVFASAQGGTTKSIDKDVCPRCGMREDSPDAVYCTNRECRFELKPCCPGCNKRIPWYKEICPYCGIDIEQKKEGDRRSQEENLNRQVQNLTAKLRDLTTDLAWVNSRRSLPNRGRSKTMLEKYNCQAHTHKLAAVLVMIVGYVLMMTNTILIGNRGIEGFLSAWDVYLHSGALFEGLIFLLIPPFSLVGFIAMVLAVNFSSSTKNKRTVRAIIETQISETRNRLNELRAMSALNKEEKAHFEQEQRRIKEVKTTGDELSQLEADLSQVNHKAMLFGIDELAKKYPVDVSTCFSVLSNLNAILWAIAGILSFIAFGSVAPIVGYLLLFIAFLFWFPTVLSHGIRRKQAVRNEIQTRINNAQHKLAEMKYPALSSHSQGANS